MKLSKSMLIQSCLSLAGNDSSSAILEHTSNLLYSLDLSTIGCSDSESIELTHNDKRNSNMLHKLLCGDVKSADHYSSAHPTNSRLDQTTSHSEESLYRQRLGVILLSTLNIDLMAEPIYFSNFRSPITSVTQPQQEPIYFSDFESPSPGGITPVTPPQQNNNNDKHCHCAKIVGGRGKEEVAGIEDPC